MAGGTLTRVARTIQTTRGSEVYHGRKEGVNVGLPAPSVVQPPWL